jgi:hypothetical protein
MVPTGVMRFAFNHSYLIIVAAEKSDKLNMQSKELQMLLMILQVFRRLLIYARDYTVQGLERKSVAAIIQSLLTFGNHHRLRLEGFRLLLIWLNALCEQGEEYLDMYQNSLLINCYSDLFEDSVSPSGVSAVGQLALNYQTFYKSESGLINVFLCKQRK